jgi:hypothetical protein
MLHLPKLPLTDDCSDLFNDLTPSRFKIDFNMTHNLWLISQKVKKNTDKFGRVNPYLTFLIIVETKL